MSTVQIEVVSSLVETLDTDSRSDSAILEQEIEDGTNVREVLNRLSTRYPRFVEAVFDVRAQKLTERVNIFLNGCNLELVNGLSTNLSDGDSLTFIAPIIGG